MRKFFWNGIVTLNFSSQLILWIQNLIIVQLLNSTNLRRIRKQNVSCVDPRNFPCVKSLNRSESNKLSLVRYTILCKQCHLRFNSCPLKILYIHVYWWFYFSNMTFFFVLNFVKDKRQASELHRPYACMHIYRNNVQVFRKR